MNENEKYPCVSNARIIEPCYIHSQQNVHHIKERSEISLAVNKALDNHSSHISTA